MARRRDEIDALYHTKRWKKLRVQILLRDFELCQECYRRGIIVKGNTVHHIIEAREDIRLFWSEDNLETICKQCHNKEHPERSGGKKKNKPKVAVVKFYANNDMG